MRRKAEVVAAVRGGLLSLDEACKRYSLTIDEIVTWQRLIERHGLPGLRTTKIRITEADAQAAVRCPLEGERRTEGPIASWAYPTWAERRDQCGARRACHCCSCDAGNHRSAMVGGTVRDAGRCMAGTFRLGYGDPLRIVHVVIGALVVILSAVELWRSAKT